MYICAGEIEQFSFAKAVGIGLVDVAINLTKLCIENKPKEIIFVGTAGSYGGKKIFDIIHSSSASHIENSFFTNKSYSPIETTISQSKDVSHETIVNSSDFITTDSTVCKHYLQEGIDIENMEFYSVLKVAKSFGIKAKGIFVVTNYCNKNAHRDFLANRIKAMKIIEEYISNE
jgi:purine-nucleoside phosphorylase